MGEVTVVDICTPEESNVTYELGVLEELHTVFNPEMAHASYIPFYCLIGRKTRQVVYNTKNPFWYRRHDALR